MKEAWLFPGAVVPVDMETTTALVIEIKRLIDVVGGMALAQLEQEPVACQYAVDVAMPEYRCVGKCQYTSPPKRPWVGLTSAELRACVDTPFVALQWVNIQQKLKEKNT